MSSSRSREGERVAPPEAKRRRRTGAGTAVALVLACLAWVAAAGAETIVAPGSIVVWAGEGIQSCGLGSEEWPPYDGECWYPIDLLRPEGRLELRRRRQGRREAAAVRISGYPYPVQRITIEDESKVVLSAADQARAAREQKRVGTLWGRRGPRRFTLPLAPPLEPLPEGGRFGSRRFFNDLPRSPHTGADYAASAGTPVHSVAEGRVVLADDLFFSGRSVFVDHGDGLISMYFHLSEMLAAEGEEVGRGQLLGKVGQTGRATGPHLHFGLRWRGARVDPRLLLGPPGDLPAVP